VLVYPVFPDTKPFGRFPGFDSLFFRYKQQVDEDAYGVLVEK